MSLPIHLIVAVAENGVIGRNGDMPWRLSTDLQRFKALTLGNPIVMGRKTWDSIGRALPGRANIVVTRDQAFSAPGAIVASSLPAALQCAEQEGRNAAAEAVFVIGGGDIFCQALPLAQKIYLTEILEAIDGDTFFPQFNRDDWDVALQEMVPSGPKDSHKTRFMVFQRR